MGWIWDTGYDPAYDHEGYAAAVLDDETVTGTHDGRTNDRFVGWRAACDCGWRGTQFWSRAEVLATDPVYAEQVTRYPSSASIAPESVDGTEGGDGALGQWRAHVVDVLPGVEVHDAAAWVSEARDELDAAVGRARAAGASWTVVGEAAGLTRQSAHERWGVVYPSPPRTTTGTTTRSAP
ncbi:hypothetical protein ACFU8R_26395 [Pseudonocardia alni]|uniref:hypothetical protein n=1 Tax=Pseudonocardia alni TaxID=33907 RepID=UPI0036BDB0BF